MDIPSSALLASLASLPGRRTLRRHRVGVRRQPPSDRLPGHRRLPGTGILAGAAADPAAAPGRRLAAAVAWPVHRGRAAGQRWRPGPLPPDPGTLDGAAAAAPQCGDLPGPGHPRHLRADLHRLPAGGVPLRRAGRTAGPCDHHPVPRDRLGLRHPPAGRSRPGLAHRAGTGR
ncbi:hypothetical protein G6F24_016118 [Rhizopus arrhizus]|nr:hypothetical protein G6F24_016118 [Rhizopus arrhizus]